MKVSDQPPPTDDQIHAKRLAEKRFVGGLLMAVGAVIAMLCGLCTLWVGGWSVITGFQTRGPGEFTDPGGLIVTALIIGGLPTGVGFVQFMIGRRIYREGRKRGGEPWKAFE